MSYEVSEPILNSPFAKQKKCWYIQEGEEPEKRTGRRPPAAQSQPLASPRSLSQSLVPSP